MKNNQPINSEKKKQEKKQKKQKLASALRQNLMRRKAPKEGQKNI